MGLLDKMRQYIGLGYDAVVDDGRRKPASGVQQSEDRELPEAKRAKLVSGMRDMPRNYSLGRWMLNCHLDYVSEFSFQATTGNDQLDDLLEELVAEYSEPENYDRAARHGLEQAVRMAEARSILDGDILCVKLADGRVQWVEGDRIRNPGLATATRENTCQGVQLDASGRALAYAVHARGKSARAFEFERWISAANAYLYGHFDRFDQVRGVSPLACVYNDLKDTRECYTYIHGKLKVAQLFGMQIFRNSEGQLGTLEEVAAEEDGGEPRYRIDFGKGPFLLDLEPGDKAEFLENKHPATETQSFLRQITELTLKALDIPYSFYAENYTNYSGARGALLRYELAAAISRKRPRRLLNHWTRWRLGLAIQDGRLPAGVTLGDLSWVWIPRGQPWLDPLKEVQADILAIQNGLDNPEDSCQRHGKNFFQNVLKIRRCNEFAVDNGVTLATALTPTDDTPEADDAEQKQAA